MKTCQIVLFDFISLVNFDLVECYNNFGSKNHDLISVFYIIVIIPIAYNVALTYVVDVVYAHLRNAPNDAHTPHEMSRVLIFPHVGTIL